jgi:hypothetical protein
LKSLSLCHGPECAQAAPRRSMFPPRRLKTSKSPSRTSRSPRVVCAPRPPPPP